MEAFPVETGGQVPSLAEDPALGLSRRQKIESKSAGKFALAAIANARPTM